MPIDRVNREEIIKEKVSGYNKGDKVRIKAITSEGTFSKAFGVVIGAEGIVSNPKLKDGSNGKFYITIDFPKVKGWCVYLEELELIPIFKKDTIIRVIENPKFFRGVGKGLLPGTIATMTSNPAISTSNEKREYAYVSNDHIKDIPVWLEDIEIYDPEEDKDQKPLNKPDINFKHPKLGLFQKFKNGKYGYNFNEDKLLFKEFDIKEDKIYSRFYLESAVKSKVNKFKLDIKQDRWGDKYIVSDSSSSIYGIYKTKKQQEVENIKNIENIIQLNCMVKVIDFKKSAETFGFAILKKDMVGKFFKINSIDYNHFHKKSDKNLPIIDIFNEKIGKNTKFLIEDLEIIQPDPNSFIKSYIPPKNRKIRVGANVKVVSVNYSNKVKFKEVLSVNLIEDDLYMHTERGVFMNRNCKVHCTNNKNEIVKLKIKQLKVI